MRPFLRYYVLLVASLAGCSSSSPTGGTPGTPQPEDPACAKGLEALRAKGTVWTFTEQAGGTCAPFPSSAGLGCGVPSNSSEYGSPSIGALTYGGSGGMNCSVSETCSVGVLCTGTFTAKFGSDGSFTSGEQTIDCSGLSMAMGGAGCSGTYTVTAP
jgi:hypothetical protein